MPDTGWREIIESGWNQLVSANKARELLPQILRKATRLNILKILRHWGSGSINSKKHYGIFKSRGLH